MNQKVIDLFEEQATRYDEWFDRHPEVFESEVEVLRQQLRKLPENIHGVEVGVGTGRFAERLGIVEGVDPAGAMREIAARRGVEVIKGVAEKLPYRDLHFDFVLFVTISFLDNAREAFAEAFRVLKRGGSIIVGFIDPDSPIGREYQKRRDSSLFYRHASFYSVDRVRALLSEAGFKNPEFMQTLFGDSLSGIRESQSPRDGYGEGSFITVRAVKG